MAVKSQEQEILRGGCKLASPSDGQYVQNMLFSNGAWHVRKGFGQVVQLDTTLSAFKATDTTAHGYERHLGSHLIETAFGNTQIVSVFSGKVRTSQLPKSTNMNAANHYLPLYFVSIYDVTTDSRWEEPLYGHTSEISAGVADAFDMQFWHPHYSTNADKSYERWVVATDPKPFFFAEFEGVLYLGNADTGVYTYFPSTFRHTGWWGNDAPTGRSQRHGGVDGLASKAWATPYGESALVTKAVATKVNPNVDYFEQSNFPKASIATTYSEAGGGSLVYVEGRTIFFSEAGRDGANPTAIPVDNWFVLPSDDDITAISEQVGNLLIWTATSTWLYKPAPGFLHVGPGSRLIKVSDSVGCLSQSAVVKGAGVGSLYWMDANGCYRATSGANIEKISGDIDPFFTNYITSPLNHYFTDVGEAPSFSMAATPRTTLSLDPTDVSAVYWPKKQVVVFCVPSIDTMLVWHLGANTWALWSTESAATDSSGPKAAATRNLPNPWLVADSTDLYLIAGPEEYTTVNTTSLSGSGSLDTTRNYVNRSYIVTRYGRGGAVDRSQEAGEDQRLLTESWVELGNVARAWSEQSRGRTILFGKPIPMQPGQTVGSVSSVPEGSVWLPVLYVEDDGVRNATKLKGLGEIKLDFTFDNTNWLIIPRTATGGGSPPDTDYAPAWEVPPERIPSADGWGYTNIYIDGITDGRHITCYTSTTKTATGNRIVASFSPEYSSGGASALAAGTDWSLSYARINFRRGKITRLLYIPFQPTTTSTGTKAQVGMGIQITTASVSEQASSAVHKCRVYAWEEWHLRNTAYSDNDKAQAVDWVYRGQDIALKQDVRVRARGAYTRLLSHGQATEANRVVQGWVMGLYNTLLGSDLKGWTSQVIDVNPGKFSENAGQAPGVLLAQTAGGDAGIRTRFKRHTGADTSADGNTSNRTFGATSDVSPKYSQATGGSPDTGAYSHRYLIDDEEINTIAVSESVQGNSVSYMVFGFLRNKAEKLVIESVKAALRILPSGRRRRGH